MSEQNDTPTIAQMARVTAALLAGVSIGWDDQRDQWCAYVWDEQTQQMAAVHRYLYEPFWDMLAAAEALDIAPHPTIQGLVDAHSRALPFLEMLTDPDTGNEIKYMSADAKEALAQLAAALRALGVEVQG